ncbi:hypothetical protein LX32DRAFT_646906 [Colletotrichum zoysiae]|uniref:Uncharacterized protein n=1 Tax=Colletotrichum zoysiae TaxID=1216348 RepID=A0AAD9H318_9PEZI|nr:hypothetical protein LX32DRAFT_646906 [Colletotrichum zoysiae]
MLSKCARKAGAAPLPSPQTPRGPVRTYLPHGPCFRVALGDRLAKTTTPVVFGGGGVECTYRVIRPPFEKEQLCIPPHPPATTSVRTKSIRRGGEKDMAVSERCECNQAKLYTRGPLGRLLRQRRKAAHPSRQRARALASKQGEACTTGRMLGTWLSWSGGGAP